VQDFLQRQRARGQLLPVVERFLTLKRERGVIDYGDQVALAARIARDCPDVAALERVRWGAVLLDEYQDTGEAQRVLLTSVFGPRPADGDGAWCVTAVGDPRQSIYGWRGASAGNLERFGHDFGGGRAASLTISFRNGERVLAAANAVAEGIPVRNLAVESLRSAPRP
jgi:DNA helicase-2/ATP-dependent DNA helicase PcrA